MATITQTTAFLKDLILTDPDGNKSKIIATRGAEAGLDHVEIMTQSREQKREGLKSVRRIYAEEFPA